MANFSYKAVSATDKKIRGIIKASSEEGARKLLERQQFTVISLEEQNKSGLSLNFLKRVSIKDKIIFTEQLGIMIKSGLSVTDALKSLQDETQNKYFAEAINDIRSQVESGTALSAALAAHPRIFPEVYIQVVKSGEVTGALDGVLNRLGLQLQKDYDLIAKVKGAMIYPIIVVTLLIGVMIVIVTYIIPKLKDVFAEAGSELPLSTRILLFISDGFIKYSWAMVIGVILFIMVFRFMTRKGQGQIIWHTIKMKLPVFGPFTKKIIFARFTQTFSSLSGAGVPVLKIFETTQNITGNVVISNEIKSIAVDVKNGVPVSFAFRKSKHFPRMVSQLAAVGEKSGEMQDVFELLANFYEKDVDNMAKNLSAAIEPLIMIVMGLGVGFILISVLQPIYGLVGQM